MASQRQGTLTRRSVVSSFIFKLEPHSKPQVALFRRSSKVRTYQHRLAPISGSIEQDDESPLAAAWRELKEETTLTPKSLDLLRQGKQYTFTDESVGREWTIYPFAFCLKSSEHDGRIQIDWEHEAWSWFDPYTVRDSESFGGVPRLAESLRRAWFELDLGVDRGKFLSDGLAMLKADHESGARVLASKALDVFIHLAISETGAPVDRWWRDMRLIAWNLWKNGRESMGAAVLTVVIRSLALLEDTVDCSGHRQISQSDLDDISAELRKYAMQRMTFVDGIWSSFQTFLDSNFAKTSTARVLTLSSSSTILECLTRAGKVSDLGFDIRILESRPMFEGVSMASKLVNALQGNAARRGKPVKISIFTDASVAIASTDIDILLLGADIISADGAVSNKTGSLPAVLCTKAISPTAKILVLAEQEKVLPYPPPGPEENSHQELVEGWMADPKLEVAVSTLKGVMDETVMNSENEKLALEIKNIYFEWILPDFIDGYLLEDGQASSADVARLAEKLRVTSDRFFSDI